MAYGSDMATAHNTVTVKLRLDLGELITQLRDLADALETTQEGDPEPDRPTDCERCGKSYDDCIKSVRAPQLATCCASCYSRETHGQLAWEAWNWSQPKPAESAADECKHEAWDVHPNGITRHCSDCRATLPEVTR